MHRTENNIQRKNMTMKKVCIILTTLLLHSALYAAQNIAYPESSTPSFTLSAPDDWILTPAGSDTDYCTLKGPTGAILYFRNIPYDAADLDKAVAETQGYIAATFTEVHLDEAVDTQLNNMVGVTAGGTGKDDQGRTIRFTCGWYNLHNGKVAEIWFESRTDDTAGQEAAKAILSSMLSR